jgi:predicted transcriptional regulator
MYKKSYLHCSNIINEGIIEDFLRKILPKNFQDYIEKRNLKKVAPKINKLTNKLNQSINNSNKLADEFEQLMKKKHGVDVKIKRKSLEDYV